MVGINKIIFPTARIARIGLPQQSYEHLSVGDFSKDYLFDPSLTPGNRIRLHRSKAHS